MKDEVGIPHASQPDCLSPEEVMDALESLADDDKLKLQAIDTICRARTDCAPNQIFHDAVHLAYLGERRCPRDVPFIAFLIKTMRSLSSHARRRLKRFVQVGMLENGDPAADGVVLAAEQLTPEEHLLEKEAAGVVEVVYAHFNDDEEAQLVIMGWADGLRGKELREAVGVRSRIFANFAKSSRRA